MLQGDKKVVARWPTPCCLTVDRTVYKMGLRARKPTEGETENSFWFKIHSGWVSWLVPLPTQTDPQPLLAPSLSGRTCGFPSFCRRLFLFTQLSLSLARARALLFFSLASLQSAFFPLPSWLIGTFDSGTTSQSLIDVRGPHNHEASHRTSAREGERESSAGTRQNERADRR
mmetsp:Transcript_42757/g.84337  ORF Transcript_42757/g.84337 Transcript_42757/m.84337 type:complete len:172 (-) Transcript_42757:1151-1666(-)